MVELTDIWDDIELQLKLAEAQYNKEGIHKYFKLIGYEGVRFSHENGFDILTVASSELETHDWRPVIGILSVKRRNTGTFDGQTSPNSLQLRYVSDERKRLIPFMIDLVSLIGSGCSPERAFESVLEDWKERFQGVGLPLSPESQRGLFGELCVLNKLLERESKSVIKTWVGPDRSLHDFVSDNWHLEVKTSTIQPGRLQIHPFSQLDPITEDFHLLMIKISLNEGQSLPDLVEEIRSQISRETVLLNHFEKMLSKEGYRQKDADLYSQEYALDNMSFITISEETPVFNRLKIDPDIACIHTIRWIMKTEGLDFLACKKEFWNNLD